MMTEEDTYRADDPRSEHDVPRAGTLHQIAYCTRCRMAFDYVGPCVPVTRVNGALATLGPVVNQEMARVIWEGLRS